MRTVLLLLLSTLPASRAAAGTWTRVDRSTLSFTGDIKEGEYGRFAAAYDDEVKELIVNSGGGLTAEGVKIGLALSKRDLTVVVDGVCTSSCANYLFVAGHRRELRRGMVGFHGNVKACFTGPEKHRAELAQMRKYAIPEAKIRRLMALEKTELADEARLLKTMGVDQALFERTCTMDKGMGDGKFYDFLLPTHATFEKYGLHGVIGDQDPEVIKGQRDMGASLAID